MSDEVAIGVCKEISERGEWTTFAIDVGSQYPVKLTTKKDSIVDDGRAANRSGATMAWHYTEVESDRINEHTGKNYRNRYLEKVVSADGAEPSGAPKRQSSQSSLGTGNVGDAERDLRITRLACLKAACEYLASKSDSTQLGVISAAESFETWVMRKADAPVAKSDSEPPVDDGDGIPF